MNGELEEDEEGEAELVPAAPVVSPPDEALEDEFPLLEVDALPPVEIDALLLPETDSPTEPLISVTVPATGEVSVVSSRACSSLLTV